MSDRDIDIARAKELELQMKNLQALFVQELSQGVSLLEVRSKYHEEYLKLLFTMKEWNFPLDRNMTETCVLCEMKRQPKRKWKESEIHDHYKNYAHPHHHGYHCS